MKHTFTHRDRSYTLDLAPGPAGTVVRIDGQEIPVGLRDLGSGRFQLNLNGRSVVLHAAAAGDQRWVALEGRVYELRLMRNGRRQSRDGVDSPEGVLRAPMPGQVRGVNVAPGEAVQKGQTLLLLEAMKMEIRIQSPCDGTVAAVPVRVGDQVEREQVLVEIQ